MHLDDFMHFNELTAFIGLVVLLVLLFAIGEWRDRRRHKRIIRESDEKAAESIKRSEE